MSYYENSIYGYVMIKLLPIVVTMLLYSETLFADGKSFFPDFSVNAGVKLGYQWSKKSSFIWGVEVSAVYNNRVNCIYGIVLDMDKGDFGGKVHIGAQASILYGGAEIGPTFFTFRDGKKETGWGISIFSGLLLYPNYTFSFTNTDVTIHELDLLIKYPAFQYFKTY